ncbi:MAG: hypothetical protein IH624_06845 [Phycisphaerae bacterium]|nr:hypothetical protein [Phycisphaerae bacterium]
MRRRTVFGAIACLMMLVATGLLLAQPQRGQRQGDAADAQRGARQRAEGQDQQGRGMAGMRDPEQMRQMMNDRMRQQLGASEDEWKLIGPRLQKVMELNRDTAGGGRGMMGMGMGMAPGGRGPAGDRGPGGRPGGDQANAPVQSAVEKATDGLQTVLQNESATAEQIKTALTTLRTAREKAKQDLAKAQQELRQLLTVKQEAMLVLMGTLN